MVGKHVLPELIKPTEAIVLFPYITIEEMRRVADLYNIYRKCRGRDKEIIWDTLSVLAFIYGTARIQGIREERAKRKQISHAQ